MTHTVSLGHVVVTVAELLASVLGIWVLTLKPRRLQTTLLGIFAILLGLQRAPTSLLTIFDVIGPESLFSTINYRTIGPLTFAAALGLAWAVPAPLEKEDSGRLLGTSLVLAFAISAVFSILRYLSTEPGVERWFHVVGGWFLHGFLLGAVLLLALRGHPSRRVAPDGLIQVALLTLSFVMYEGFTDGGDIVRISHLLLVGSTNPLVFNVVDFGAWLFVVGLWLRNMLAAGPSTVPIHRATCLGILGLLTAGAFFDILVDSDPIAFAILGLVRMASVLVMAYGILRHDLAGLDEKVEFGLSKTTVAGIFVAVFFVVSEGAQAVFADFAGNELLGVLAAGMLVFAISPLQRFADRFAARAVPGGAEAGAGVEEQYRTAVEMALVDGEIDRDEERRLAEKADELGIDTTRAFELREQVEDEGEGGDAP